MTGRRPRETKRNNRIWRMITIVKKTLKHQRAEPPWSPMFCPSGREARDSGIFLPGLQPSSAAAVGLAARLFGLTNAEAEAASPLHTAAHSFSFCSAHGLKIALLLSLSLLLRLHKRAEGGGDYFRSGHPALRRGVGGWWCWGGG